MTVHAEALHFQSPLMEADFERSALCYSYPTLMAHLYGARKSLYERIALRTDIVAVEDVDRRT